MTPPNFDTQGADGNGIWQENSIGVWDSSATDEDEDADEDDPKGCFGGRTGSGLPN